MAMRRPRTSNRLIAKSNQHGVAEREEDGAERGGKPRKRKLSDMLGPAWSKDDLELFYQSYRKFGKDWKKVAGSMQKRTMEMVEALYGMNRAYLSLPEGAASAEGLIAMMTDHYNILEESEDDSSEEFGTSDRSHQMYSRLRTRATTVSHTNSGPSGYGGPSPAKKPRSAAAGRPWMVGKRTPRYPIGNTVEQKGKNKVVTNKMPLEGTSEEDHEFSKEAEGVALTLITTLHQAPSSLVPKHTPTHRNSRTTFQNGHARETTVKVESGGSGPKPTASTSGEVGPEGSQDSKEKAPKSSSSATVDETELLNGGRGQTSDGKSRWRKPPAKRPKLHKPDVKNDESNEQCSQTGVREDTREEDDGKVISGQKKKRHSLQRTKRRSRQLFSGDKSSALDALATLADLSLNGLLPSPTHADSEEKEDKPQRSESGPQVVRKSGERNGKELEKRDGHRKVHDDERAKEQTGKEDLLVASGSRQQSTSPPESRKRKRKTVLEKLPLEGKYGAEDQVQNKAEPQVQPTKVETPVVLKPRRKPKRVGSTKTLTKQGVRVNKAGQVCGLDMEVAVCGGGQSADDGTLPLKLRSKKKGVAEKGPVNGFGDVSTSGLRAEIVKAPNCPHTTAELGPFNTKARLIHCLSPKVRRWCMYEWFYSAIDLPWFAHNEFVEYLHHAGLGHVPRLTRVEWGVVRSSLGKPRRLSKSFLQEERDKLGTYRENVRTHYHELRTGLREGLPSDLARPLTVGQRVIARHPKTRQIHDGSILTVDRSKCRVQFDRPELGVEFVMDIDAMPIHPLENMPEIMRRKRVILDAMDRSQGDSKFELKSRVAVSAGGAARAALNERLERPGSIPGVAVFSQIFLNNLTRIAQVNSVDSVRLAKAATSEAVAATQQALVSHPFTPGQSQAREIDIRTLVELGGALNKKETLVVELRRMNDESASYKGSEALERQCTAIVLKLKEVNEQVFEALKQLRHRSKLQDSALSLWHRSSSLSLVGGPSLAESSLTGSMEAGFGIADIAASSKKHARAMVSVAVKTISAVNEGEDPLVKMSEALDLVAKGSPLTQGKIPSSNSSSCTQGSAQLLAVGSTSASLQPLATVDANGDIDTFADGESDARANRLPAEDTPISSTEEALATRGILSHASHGESKEALILSELMASCVASLLMVQTLTDRQYSAPDVAVTLDNALESLRPQAAQNHCIFRDIEQQLGYIKTQIVAQIPIQSSVPFPVENPISQSINPT